MPRGRKTLVFLAGLLLLLVGLASAGLRARALVDQVQGESGRGQAELVAGADILKAGGPSLTKAQAAAAVEHFGKAEADFAHGHALLVHSRLVIAVGWLPGLHRQVVAATELTDMGVHVSRAGRLAVDAFIAFQSGDTVSDDHKAPGERLLNTLDKLDPKFSSIENELNQIAIDRAAIPRSGLNPQISKAVEQFDTKLKLPELRATLATLRADEPAFRRLLGSDGPQSYVVLQQDPAELRATGGFIGSLGYLSFDHGKMAPYQPEDIYQIDGDHYGSLLGTSGSPHHVDAPYPLQAVFRLQSWELRDSNWSPDFPTSARQAESFLQLEAGKHVDGVIAIDPFLIAKLLSVIGPVKVPETGDVVDDKSFYETTLLRVELHQGPESARKSFLSYAAKAIFARLLTTPPKDWLSLLKVLQSACDSRSLQVYFHDPQLETLITSYHCGGQVQPFRADGVMVVDSNLGGLKYDFWLERSFGLKLDVHSDGTIRHTLHLHYDGLTPHQRLTGIWGYTGWTRVYLPQSSHVVSVSGATLTPASELGRMVLEGWLYVPYYKATDITVVYDTDSNALSIAGGGLNFLWQKQAGRVADPISIQVSLPSGWRLGVTRMGADPSGDSVIHTDLSVDRPFVFQFERS